MSDENDMTAGARVSEFLNDDHVTAAIAKVQARYVEEWKASDTAAKREEAYFKSRAFDDLRKELEITVQNGQVAAIKVARNKPAQSLRPR